MGDPFALPFECIEGLAVVDGQTLMVVDDNNYPISTGRNPQKPDDSEFILIQLGKLLAEGG